MQSVIINISLFAVFYYFVLTDEVEEKDPTQHTNSRTEDERITTKGGQEVAEDENEDTGEDESVGEGDDEFQIPDTIPEGAYFIPLGFARQRPQTYYKGSDPEWQSFLEFAKDRQRGLSIRREACLETHLRSRD